MSIEECLQYSHNDIKALQHANKSLVQYIKVLKQENAELKKLVGVIKE